MEIAQNLNNTAYEEKLFQALCIRGVNAQSKYKDGHKTVDIAILDAHIYIEVDGLQHFTDPKQIVRDFQRQHYSEEDGFHTFYVTNQIIENYTDQVADAIAQVVQDNITKDKITSIV